MELVRVVRDNGAARRERRSIEKFAKKIKRFLKRITRQQNRIRRTIYSESEV